MKITTEQYVLGGIAGFLMLFMLGMCGGGGSTTPEAAGEAIFKYVKAGDQAGLRKLGPSLGDLKAMVKQSDAKAERKKELLETLDRGYAEYNRNFDRSYERLMDEMKESGIDPASIEFVKVEVEKIRERGGLPLADIAVVFKSGDKEYAIENEMIKIGNKWMTGPKFRLDN